MRSASSGRERAQGSGESSADSSRNEPRNSTMNCNSSVERPTRKRRAWCLRGASAHEANAATRTLRTAESLLGHTIPAFTVILSRIIYQNRVAAQGGMAFAGRRSGIDVDYLKVEPLWRKQYQLVGYQVRPRLVRGVCHRRIQEQQKLVGEAVDRRRLAESQPQTDGLLERNPLRGHFFVAQQRDKTGATGVRPHVGMQQVPQRLDAFEGDFALADPFQHRITHLPVREQRLVLVRQLYRQVELPLFGDRSVDVARRQHLLGFEHYRVQVGPLVARGMFGETHDERRQLVRLPARNLDIPLAAHDTSPALTDRRKRGHTLFHGAPGPRSFSSQNVSIRPISISG